MALAQLWCFALLAITISRAAEDTVTPKDLIYQLSPALQKHRPIRKEAPVYGVTHRVVAEAREAASIRNQPVVESHDIKFEQIETDGVWTWLKVSVRRML